MKFIIYYKIMNQSKIKDFITQDITILAGVGTKTKKLLKKRKVLPRISAFFEKKRKLRLFESSNVCSNIIYCFVIG